MITATILALSSMAVASPAPAVDGATYTWDAPASYIEGESFDVKVEVELGAAGGEIEAWQLTPAAFDVNGKALGKREKGSISLPAGARLELTFNLGASLSGGGAFELSYAPAGKEERKVKAYTKVTDVDFLAMDVSKLSDYNVLLRTNRGDMLVEFWPDVAPNHVRNFLELSRTGFYDGILFHRVIPGFMIQGGDPLTKDPAAEHMWGTGSGPRRLDQEFNKKKHVRGVLSMARTNDPNSATSQFFICHDRAANLDNQYSGFGMLIDGFETLDAIATTPQNARNARGQTVNRPIDPQRIENAFVVKARK